MSSDLIITTSKQDSSFLVYDTKEKRNYFGHIIMDTEEYLTHEEMLEIAEQRESMNAKKLEIDKQFDDWFYELEGFAFRSERFWDDFDYAKDSKDNQSMVKWLRSAYEVGYNEGQRLYGGTE